MTSPTVYWPLLLTFGHISAVSNQIVLPAETTVTEKSPSRDCPPHLPLIFIPAEQSCMNDICKGRFPADFHSHTQCEPVTLPCGRGLLLAGRA